GVVVQSQVTVAVSGSAAESVPLQSFAMLTGVDMLPVATFPMVTVLPVICPFDSWTLQLSSATPPVFLTRYCTFTDSAAMFVPSTVKAFQPRHDPVPSSLLETKLTSTKGPAPHFTCLSTCAVHGCTSTDVGRFPAVPCVSNTLSCSEPFTTTAEVAWWGSVTDVRLIRQVVVPICVDGVPAAKLSPVARVAQQP